MKKLQTKLDLLLNSQSELEAQISRIEDKIRRQSFRRDRKQFRKKMARDSAFRAMHGLLSRIERSMYGELPAPGQVFSSLSKMVEGK